MSIRNLVASLGLCAAVILPSLASAQTYMENGYRHRFRERTRGAIVNIDKTTLTLRRGIHIFLLRGTVINPTGRPLRVGQYVVVFGPPGGPDSINAREIDILPRRGGM